MKQRSIRSVHRSRREDIGDLVTRRPIPNETTHGPFVMNTREEILEAVRDYQAGKFRGVVSL